MSTNQIRELADAMDEDGFDPATWLIVATNESGDVVTYWPASQSASLVGLLSEAQEAARRAMGAPGGVQ